MQDILSENTKGLNTRILETGFLKQCIGFPLFKDFVATILTEMPPQNYV
jgi:hypothetical protein